MKKASKSIWSFIWAMIGLIVAVQIAWAVVEPFVGYIALVGIALTLAIFVGPRVIKALGASGKYNP
ncbi:hypothetical protein [Rhodococcus sp. NPDC004095]